MIELAVAHTDDELETWRQVRLRVYPEEPAQTVDEMRASGTPERLLLLARFDGAPAGSGIADLSSTPGRGWVAPRVLPELRRRGIGTALLRRLVEHCEHLELQQVTSEVDGSDPGLLEFARRFGFEEIDRQVEQVYTVSSPAPAPPPLPDGVEVVTVAARPEALADAYDLAVEGYADMATPWPVTIRRQEWLREEATLPEASLVALANGEIVGYAGLCCWNGRPASAVNGLTVVRRAWGGGGVAYALKRRQLAWAAANDLREIVTWTQRGNENMQRVNARLGYVNRSVSLTVAAPLPLR